MRHKTVSEGSTLRGEVSDDGQRDCARDMGRKKTLASENLKEATAVDTKRQEECLVTTESKLR